MNPIKKSLEIREDCEDSWLSITTGLKKSKRSHFICLKAFLDVEIGTEGKGGRCPHFLKTRAKCPFLCNLVALLENFEDLKLNRKIHVPGNFIRS